LSPHPIDGLAVAGEVLGLLAFRVVPETEDKPRLAAVHIGYFGADLEHLPGVEESKLPDFAEAHRQSKLSANTGFSHIPADTLAGSGRRFEIYREPGFYAAGAIFEGADVFHGNALSVMIAVAYISTPRQIIFSQP